MTRPAAMGIDFASCEQEQERKEGRKEEGANTCKTLNPRNNNTSTLLPFPSVIFSSRRNFSPLKLKRGHFTRSAQDSTRLESPFAKPRPISTAGDPPGGRPVSIATHPPAPARRPSIRPSPDSFSSRTFSPVKNFEERLLRCQGR